MLQYKKNSLLPVALNSGKDVIGVLGCWEGVDGILVVFDLALDVVVEVDGKAVTVIVDKGIIDAGLEEAGPCFALPTGSNGNNVISIRLILYYKH